MQEVGHTYGLHHCLDPRCAMYPQWTPSYALGEASFCTYCRDSSDAKIRTTKS
jgi:predicted Zn-dependent protease